MYIYTQFPVVGTQKIRREITSHRVRIRADFVGSLGRHGRHLQTIEPRLRIELCVCNVQENRKSRRI
jgi:hypothetical protein